MIERSGNHSTTLLFEDELVLSHLRVDLPQRWRSAFEANVLASPARRRRVEAASHLRQALGSFKPQAVALASGAKRALWKTPIGLWMAAAAGIVGVFFSGWLIGRRAAPDREAVVPNEISRPQPGAIATFVLAPGLTRSELGASNVFRVEPGILQVRLELSASTSAAGPFGAVLRLVGGETIAVETEPEFRHNGDRVDGSWTIAAPLLPRGDYLLTIVGETSAGQRGALASRFFSIVE